MIKKAHTDERAVLFQFDNQDELRAALGKLCRVKHPHLSFIYLPPEISPSDPHPQRGYVGMRWDD